MSNVAAGKKTDDEGEKLNDVEKVMNKLGIKLRDSIGEWRNFEEVLDEVAAKWKNFSEVQRSQMATALAGTRQQETFRALMNNYDQVKTLTQVAADSAGSATKRMNIYLESVEAKTNELKATWEEFVMSLNQSESYKSFLDFCIWILNNMPAVIGYVTALLVLFKGHSIVTGIKKITESLAGVVPNITKLNTLLLTTKKNLVLNENGTYRFATSEERAAATTDLLNLKLGLLKLGLAAGIAILTFAIQKYQEYKQAQLDAVSSTQEEVNKINENITSLDEIKNKYEEVTNSVMTNEEKKSSLKSLQEQLNSVYETEAEKIDLVNGKYEEQIELLNDIEKKEIAEQTKKLNENSSQREGALGTWTNTQITDIDENSEAGKLLVETMQKYAPTAIPMTTNYGLAGAKVGISSSMDADELVQMYEELQEKMKDLSEEGQKELGKYLNSSTWLTKSMKEDYEKFSESYHQQQEADLMNFINKNVDEYLAYKNALAKRKQLYQEYLDEEDGVRKQDLLRQIDELTDSTNQQYNILKEKAYGNSTIMNALSDKLSNYKIDYSKELDWNKVEGYDYEDFRSLQKEISKSSELSDELKQKIWNIREAVKALNNENALKEFDEQLKGLGISASDAIKSIQGIRSTVLNEDGTFSTENVKEYERFEHSEEELLKSLKDAGIQFNQQWYDNLKEKFKNGEIDGKHFFDELSKVAKVFGVNLEEAVSSLDGVADKAKTTLDLSQYGEYSAGTDTKFKAIPDEIKNLKTIQNNFSNGKGDYDDIRHLVDNYEKLNNKVQETGDVMSITGDDIQEVIDDITDAVNDDLDKIIDNAQRTMDEVDNIVNDGFKALQNSTEDSLKDLGKVSEDAFTEAYEDAMDALKKDGNQADLKFIDPTVVSGDIDLVIDKIEELGAATSETEAIANMLEGAFAFANDGTEVEMLDLLSQAFDITDQSLWNLIATKITEDEVTMQQLATMAQENEEVAGLFAQYGLLDTETGELTITSQTLSNALPALIGNFGSLSASAQNAAASIMSAAYSQGVMNNAINGSTAEQIQGLSNKVLGTAKAKAYGTKQEATVRKSGLRNISNGNLDGKKPSSGGSKGSGSKNNYTAEDAAEDLKGILNDIEDYERDIEADLEDQTEELINHYNLQRNKLDLLKEELDYYDDIYDSVEDTTKWLNNQLNILDEESEKVAELQNSSEKIMAQRDKIYKENSGYNVASWFDEAMNETLAYGDLINSFEYRKEAIQKETAKKMRDVYNSVSGSTDKDTISDAKKKIKNIEDEADLKIKELDKEKEKVENIYDSVEKLNDAWKDNQEAIRDSLQELNDRIKETRDELIDQIMEQLERAVDKMNTSIEKDVTRLEQLKDVQESYNDILNDTIDTQQELDDELRANMDTYQYLDETMRQLMFNEDDYKQLSKVLEGVQQDIADIWEDHYNQIQNLTEDEMYKAEYITAETERQLAAKQKEYDLAKAELDVAKAQTNLQNVLNERNTRVFANGEWSWVANPDNVKSARQQVADAEREKTRLEREKEQQKLIDSMDRIIDSDNLQIDKNNDLLEKIQEAIERETEEVKSVEEALLNADKANLPALTTTLVGALGSDGGYMKELLGEINHSQVELAAALRGQTIEQAVNQLKSGSMSKLDFNELVSRLGYSFSETTGEVTTQDGTFAAHYAGWTKKSNADKQLTTAPNGVQVTGNQNSSSTTSIASAEARAQNNNLEQIAREVWLGKWGNGADRKRRLEAAGYNYSDVQALVNKGRNYFFDQGGLATGLGSLSKDTILPERVLSPRQTKAFENLVTNLTTNPVLNALSKVPSISSKLGDLSGETNNSKNYYFRDFTVKADDIEQFISSIETMMPIKK